MLDLKSKTANIMHALGKFPLSTVDIFFFNDACAITNGCCCCCCVVAARITSFPGDCASDKLDDPGG